MTKSAMRAKVRVTSMERYKGENDVVISERLNFHFPAKDGPYPADGSDEDQQFARFSPGGSLSLLVANPNLLGKFKVDDTFYLDFIPVEEKASEAVVPTDFVGFTVRDKISGFQGVVTGDCRYISGCQQLLVAPPAGSDGAFKSAEWIDLQRLELLPGVDRIVLNNGSTPGADRAPPKR